MERKWKVMRFYFLIAIILAVMTLITLSTKLYVELYKENFFVILKATLFRRTANLCRVKSGQQIDKKFVGKTVCIEFCWLKKNYSWIAIYFSFKNKNILEFWISFSLNRKLMKFNH